jgi:hypothetical protein
MAAEYYCDICGNHTGSYRTEVIMRGMIPKEGSTDKNMDLCANCYKALRTFVNTRKREIDMRSDD